MIRKIMCLGILFLAAQNVGAISVSLLGLQDNSQETSSNLRLATAANYGQGLLVNTQLGQSWMLSAGGMYFTRGWVDSTAGTSNLSSQVLMAPVLFTYHLKYFSFGLGGFYSQNQGNLSSAGTVNNSSLAYSSYGIKNYDYGYLGQVGFHVPLGSRAAFRMSALYAGGANNVSLNSANTFQNRDLLYTAGFSLGFGAGNLGPEGGHSSSKN